jgi:hypothetical protein
MIFCSVSGIRGCARRIIILFIDIIMRMGVGGVRVEIQLEIRIYHRLHSAFLQYNSGAQLGSRR